MVLSFGVLDQPCDGQTLRNAQNGPRVLALCLRVQCKSKERYGLHSCVCVCVCVCLCVCVCRTPQVTIADILRKVRSFTEAERMCKGAFEVALRVGGPEHPVTGHAYLTYTLLLSDQNRLREQRAFQARAKKLGVRMNLPY